LFGRTAGTKLLNEYVICNYRTTCHAGQQQQPVVAAAAAADVK